MQRNAMQGRAEQRNATRWSFQPSADYGRLLGGYWYSPNAQHRIAVNRIAKHRNAKHGTAAQCIAKQGIATRYQLIASVGFVESLSGCLLRHQMQSRAAQRNAGHGSALQSRAKHSKAEQSTSFWQSGKNCLQSKEDRPCLIVQAGIKSQNILAARASH